MDDAGRAATRRILDRATSPGTLQHELLSASVTAHISREQTLYQSVLGSAWLSAGSSVTLLLRADGIEVRAHPGIHTRVGLDQLTVSSVFYEFATGRFHTQGSLPVDLFGIGAWMDDRLLDAAMNHWLRPKLPHRMQRAGYSVNTDPDLAGTVNELRGAFGGSHEGGQGGAHPAPHGPQQQISDVSASATLLLDETIRVPLGRGIELRIEHGSWLTATARTHGVAPHLALEALSISVPDSGIRVGSTSHSLVGSLAAIHVHQIDVHRPGRFAFDYDMNPERAVDTGISLLQLFETIASHGRTPLPHDAPDVHIRALRHLVDQALQREVPPQLRHFLERQQAKHALGGLNLMSLFG